LSGGVIATQDRDQGDFSMPKLEFVRPGDTEFVPAIDTVSAARLATIDDAHRESLKHIATRPRHLGSPELPVLLEVRFEPNVVEASHAHSLDEIMLVTAGEIHFGNAIYGPGSSIFIPKDTLYAFKAGPEGLSFLIFRPASGAKIMSREELLAKKRDAAVA
jgi:hypothetical protein